MSQIDNARFIERQLRSQKALAVRLRKDNERLRQQVAQLKLRAPMNDVLLVVMRLCRANYELLLDLLDRRGMTEAERMAIAKDFAINDAHIKQKD